MRDIESTATKISGAIESWFKGARGQLHAPPLPTRKTIVPDLIAGLVVGAVCVGENMAYAIVAGVPPVYGLYAATLTVIVSSLLLGSDFIIVTFGSTFAMISAESLGALEEDQIVAGIVTLTLMIGLMQLLIGLFRLGGLTRFISREIMSGFLAAVGVGMVLGQLGDLVGYQSVIAIPEPWSGKVIKGIDTLANFLNWDWPTAVIGLAGVAIALLVAKTKAGSLWPLIVIAFATLVAWIFGLDSVEVIGDMSGEGGIPQGLPTPVAPDILIAPVLFVGALAMVIIGLIETEAATMSYRNTGGDHPTQNRAQFSMGLANIAGSIMTAMPGDPSLSRSGLNVKAGAKTMWSGVFAGLLVLVVLLMGGTVVEQFPLTALAGILIIIGVEIFRHEIPVVVGVWRSSKPHSIALLATFFFGVTVSIELGVFLGIFLSLLVYLYFSSRGVELVRLVRNRDGMFEEAPVPKVLEPNSAILLTIKGNLYFASSDTLKKQMPSIRGASNSAIIINLYGRESLDPTNVLWLTQLDKTLDDSGSHLLLVEVPENIHKQMKLSGLLEKLGEENVFVAGKIVNGTVVNGLERAAILIDEGKKTTG